MVNESPAATADGRADRLRLEQLVIDSEQRAAAVPTLEARVAELEHEVAAARAQATAASRRAQELGEQLSEQVEAMTEITGSVSWRLTRPLRRAQKIRR